MKTKTIPLDLESARKIQSGEIKGEIKTRIGEKVRILCTDVRSDYPIVAVVTLDDGVEEVRTYNANCSYIDRGSCYPTEDSRDLVLEVPDNEPQFKPFDKVLCRHEEDDIWEAGHFSRKDNDSQYPYHVCGGIGYKQCIPYEGNEHLVGTTNKPKED